MDAINHIIQIGFIQLVDKSLVPVNAKHGIYEGQSLTGSQRRRAKRELRVQTAMRQFAPDGACIVEPARVKRAIEIA